MRKKLLFVYNPHAGKSKIRGKVSDILSCFIRAGYVVEVYVTQAAMEATEVVKKRGGRFQRIVCSGGDGTLNEVISGLMQLPPEKRPILGYIPAGTTNDFARSLKLPTDMVKAAQVAVKGEEFPIDIGCANQSYFTYVYGFGAFTEVSYETPQEMKKVLGHQAYILEGAKSLMTLKPHHMKITWEDQTIEDEFLFGSVSNSYSVAGMKGLWGKEIRLNDGAFEVTLVRQPQNVLEWPELMAALITKGGKSPSIIQFKAKQIHFSSPEEVRWVKDGEFAGSWQEVDIENLHLPLTIVKNA
ncbi:diacylglycerol/lipid kinase family protein [Hominifimenecus sp. rT4P-3]|uniref:diacylglycerol/lipid kinase family protein n=1 Tax=Hominifimenecus sp. rT4P-3 TaxID=3242979 RepID=UPI003DA2B405